MRRQALLAGVFFGAALLSAGCRENFSGLEQPDLAPGWLRFTSAGIHEAGFSAEGAPAFSREGRVGLGSWAVAGRNRLDPEGRLTVVAHSGASRDSSILIAFSIPHGEDGGAFRIQRSCTTSDCTTMSLYFGADPASPRAEEADMTCRIIEGFLSVDLREEGMATGEFHGFGPCRIGPNGPNQEFGINAGQFSVPVANEYRVDFDP